MARSGHYQRFPFPPVWGIAGARRGRGTVFAQFLQAFLTTVDKRIREKPRLLLSLVKNYQNSHRPNQVFP
jgi:hypothetical protein